MSKEASRMPLAAKTQPPSICVWTLHRPRPKRRFLYMLERSMLRARGSIRPASAVAITTFAPTFVGHSRSAVGGVLSFGKFTKSHEFWSVYKGEERSSRLLLSGKVGGRVGSPAPEAGQC